MINALYLILLNLAALSDFVGTAFGFTLMVISLMISGVVIVAIGPIVAAKLTDEEGSG